MMNRTQSTGMFLFLAILLSAPLLASEELVQIRGAQKVGDAVVGVPVDIDLRSLPTLAPWREGDPIREVPRRYYKDPVPMPEGNPVRLDPLVESQRNYGHGPSMFTEVENFEANSSTANPNDPTGDVGMDYFIEGINGPGGTSVTIYDKDTTALVSGPFALDTLGTGICAGGLGDPIFLYDHLAERWFLSEFSSGGNGLCIYTSRTADPIAGGWCAYQFADSSFPDYPKFGLWPDMYVATSNQGNVPPVYAFDRANMLSPDGVSCPTARATQKVVGPGLPVFGFEAFTPADLDGPEPPAGEPAILMRHRDEELVGDPPNALTDPLEMWEFDVDFDNAGNTTFTQLSNVIISDYDSNLCPPISFFSCIPQPSGGSPLDPLLEVIMHRLTYRNFGSHEVIVGVLQTDVGDFADHSGERWFVLRRDGGGAGTWTLEDEGTYSPDSEHRFMGMIGMDGSKNILLAYNVSSTTVHPSIRYTGRLRDDAPGVMTFPETTLAPGGGVNSSFRYGDYNQMGVDPEDNCTFWFLGMYNPSGKGVRIGAVKIDSCTGSLDLFTDGFESGDVSAWSVSRP